MQNVTLDKGELQKILLVNRKKHVVEYKEAKESYRKVAIAWFKEQLSEAKGKRPFETHFSEEQEPTDHSAEYDRIIQMLELEIEPQVSLTRGEFSQYVQDEWGWQYDFKKSAVFYNESAGSIR